MPFQKGHKCFVSKEAYERAANKRKGRVVSEKTKRKLRNAMLASGHKPPSQKGIKRSENTKKKLRLAHIGQSAWNKGREFKAIIGKKHWNWKGGITNKNEAIRKSLEYKLWRRAVFERDNWTCVWCKQKGGEVHADHIKPFAYFPELRFALDNGRTLCKPCHKTTNTYSHRYKNNEHN